MLCRSGHSAGSVNGSSLYQRRHDRHFLFCFQAVHGISLSNLTDIIKILCREVKNKALVNNIFVIYDAPSMENRGGAHFVWKCDLPVARAQRATGEGGCSIKAHGRDAGALADALLQALGGGVGEIRIDMRKVEHRIYGYVENRTFVAILASSDKKSQQGCINAAKNLKKQYSMRPPELEDYDV